MKTSPVTVLPAALKAWRGERGMSQQDLAEAADLSAGLIGLIGTGRRQPGLANLLSIARALDVSPHAIALVHVDLSALATPTEAAS